MNQRWHSVVIQNDEGDDDFLKAAPLLLQALQIIKSAKTLTAAVQLSHRTNELFSGFEIDDNTSSICFSSSSFGKIRRSIEKLRPKQKMLYPVLDTILSSFSHVQHCASANSISPTTETTLKRAGINNSTNERSFSVPTPGKNNITDNQGVPAQFSFDRPGYSLPSKMHTHGALHPVRRTHEPLTVCHQNGLIYPRQMFLDRDLFEHPTLDYTNFRKCFGRLSDIAADPKLFTACEPRLRILKSRYALYSAYNGSREDQCDPVLGGGSVTRAPKSDIRRLETCISARSLIKFIESIYQSDPNYVVNHSAYDENTAFTRGDESSSASEAQKGASLNSKHTEKSLKAVKDLDISMNSCINKSDAKLDGLEERNSAAEEKVTVRDLVMRFWGVEGKGENFPLNHDWSSVKIVPNDTTCALTPERLFLTPQYAQAIIDSCWSDFHHTLSGENKIPSQVQQVYENLRNFLSINNENEGDLFAKLVIPTLSRILHTPGSEFDSLELEVSVSGCEYGELDRIADWCVRSGILDENRICFSIHVTQGAFATSNEDSHYRNEESMPWWWLMCQEHLRKTNRGDLATQAETFQDVLQNIFEPIWDALLDPESHPNLVRFLQRLSSFSISLGHTPAVLQELPEVSSPSQYTLHSSDTAPSNAFLAFHIQRNVQLLNCFTCAHEYFYRVRDSNQTSHHGASETKKRGGGMGTSKKYAMHRTQQGTAESQGDFNFWSDVTQRFDSEFTYSHHLPLHTLYHQHAPILPGPLRLRLHSSGSNNSRTMFTESILGLLLADEVVNPAQAFEWGPLTYLYYLTQRHVVLTPSTNHHSNSIIKKTLTDNAILLAVRAGLHVSLATLNPLFFHNTDDALNEELLDTRKHLALATTDITEMCLRSMESRIPHFCGSSHVMVGGGAKKKNRDHEKCLREAFFGEAWPRAEARYNNFSLTQVSSLRLNFRDAALSHEMDLLCRKALPQVYANPSFEVPLMSFLSQPRSPERVSAAAFRDDISLCTHESQLATRRKRLYTFFSIPSSDLPSTTEREWDGDQKGLTARKDSHQQSRHGHLEETLRFPRIKIIGPKNESPSDIAKMVVRCMALRQNYQQYAVKPSLSFYKHQAGKHADKVRAGSGVSHGKSDTVNKMGTNTSKPFQPDSYAIRDGIIDVLLNKNSGRDCNEIKGRGKNTTATSYDTHPFVLLPTWATFQQHVLRLRALSNNQSVQEFCSKRLGMLECKYNLHIALTKDDEEAYFVEIPSEGYDDANLTALCLPLNSESSEGIQISNTTLEDAVSSTGHDSYPHYRSNRSVLRRDPKADVFNIVKVDVHCHMAGGFTAKSLLSFFKHKVQFHGNDVIGVDTKSGLAITLSEMYRKVVEKRLDLFFTGNTRMNGTSQCCSHLMKANEMNSEESLPNRIQDLTIAALDVQAGKATFNRFDEFNSRYSPMRVSELRSLLLKTDNFMGGRYFAELIRNEVFEKNEKEGNIFTENRLSIYGRDHGEWMRLANWAFIHGMAHHTNRWMIQIPRLFNLYRLSGVLKNFEEMLWNIFDPLWQASLYPEKHPLLHYFLQHISGFDSVDNESSLESGEMVLLPPVQWTRAENPPFAYYMYYMWANITTLNRFRASRGLCTFDFRPHAGESGDPDHMADVFFLADGIGHGINLIKRPVLRYLYYLTQIPLAIVPLSNNALFCKYSDNPFPTFFRQGLNVSLGTDGALMFHNTEQPLLEEYTTAQNVWSLSSADVCEIAKRSVLMSGFPSRIKAQWLGDRFFLHSVIGNDVGKSHLPMTRCALRYEVYMDEILYLEARAALDIVNRAMFTPTEENYILMDTIGCSRVEALRQCLWGCPSPVNYQSHAQSTGLDKNSEQKQGNVPKTEESPKASHILRCANGSSILAQSQL